MCVVNQNIEVGGWCIRVDTGWTELNAVTQMAGCMSPPIYLPHILVTCVCDGALLPRVPHKVAPQTELSVDSIGTTRVATETIMPLQSA